MRHSPTGMPTNGLGVYNANDHIMSHPSVSARVASSLQRLENNLTTVHFLCAVNVGQ